jgi:predicted transport protein
MPPKLLIIIVLTLLTLASKPVLGQVEIQGTVYDRSRYFAMPGVSVMGTSGQGAMTDSVGHYHIRLALNDSLYFSYLGRPTVKFPVKGIYPNAPMDISLAVAIDSLPLVVVRPKAYRYDSLENRDEYRKIFDYEPDYIGQGAGGAGVNLDLLFGARRNRQMLALKQRLEEEERDKYIDYRFNKTLVRRITGLQRNSLDIFMRMYRPSYEFIRNCENDYEFYKYIKDCGLYFTRTYKEYNP